MEMRRWRVTGRVQGVGFRWWTQREGASLGLRGTVRNCPDGSVEVVAAGSTEVLDRLGERLTEGPPLARVDAVELRPAGHRVPDDGFHIVR